ncbi:hypothetical protein SRABI96_02627 [Peribacillus sp. Bi96]|uniref:hypothetical protein n=1 Tax=unclassified Peribacillus TaxID=2675266 RepID=UPI001D4CA468|nr:hypothetical protein [Peribacillus sp. Bi96]CAH0229010.1 hypothetical protein SRABI96_02627 [Peribacillus sp. Bi96]
MEKIKEVNVVFLFTIIILAVFSFVVGFQFYEYKTKTTDLSKENIDHIYLLETMDKYRKNHFFSIAKDVSHPGYKMYNIDKNINKRITVDKSKKNKRIYRIETFDSSSKTSKNVSIGTSVKDFINIYGENYIERSSDQTDKIIEYIDRDNDIFISFFIYNDQVDGINLEVKDF